MVEVAPRLKFCPGCSSVKSHFALSSRKATRHGVVTYLKTRCTDCTNRERKDTRRLNRIFSPPPPGSPCECCARVRPLLLDHDHQTSQFRGWLCRECNSGLGFLGDNLEGDRAGLSVFRRLE
jgi:hypothetical protein